MPLALHALCQETWFYEDPNADTGAGCCSKTPFIGCAGKNRECSTGRKRVQKPNANNANASRLERPASGLRSLQGAWQTERAGQHSRPQRACEADAMLISRRASHQGQLAASFSARLADCWQVRGAGWEPVPSREKVRECLFTHRADEPGPETVLDDESGSPVKATLTAN